MSTPIQFEGLSNVRDLGGMRTKQGRTIRTGRLFRSDQLFFASETDRAKLEQMGIRLVADFRSGIERDEKPDPELPGAINLHLPIIRDVLEGVTRDENSNKRIMARIMAEGGSDLSFIDSYMNDIYRNFVADSYSREQYAQFVDEVIAALRQDGSALWHCTAGKDRAGFATVILLEALDVPREDIKADYLQTNECLEGITAQIVNMLTSGALIGQKPQIDNETLESVKIALAHFLRADEEFLAGAYAAADELFGSFGAYLEQGLGLDAAKRTELEQLCLEAE